MKVVLDTNVVVSGVIKAEGPPGQILQRLLGEKKFTVLTSLEILAELREVLGREKIRKHHGWTDEQIDAFVASLYDASVVTAGMLTVTVVERDPRDDKFLACAREGLADYVVSGDDHLLAIKAYQGIEIVPPAAFLDLLASEV